MIEEYIIHITAVSAHCNLLVKSAIQHPLKFPLKKWIGPWVNIRISCFSRFLDPQNFTSNWNSSDIKLIYFDTSKSFVPGFTSFVLEDQVPTIRWLRTSRLPTTELSETTSVAWGWGASRFCCGFLSSLCPLVSLALLLVSSSHWHLPRQFHQHQDQQHPNH